MTDFEGTKWQTYGLRDVEEALLSTILLNSNSVIEIAGIVKNEDFARYENRTIFEHVMKLSLKGESVNIHTIARSLQTQNVLEKTGGIQYLQHLVGSYKSGQDVKYIAKMVHEKAHRRKRMEIVDD